MLNNVNPMQLIQMIKSGKNPQDLIMSFLEDSVSNTPVGQNLLSMAKSGNSKNIENFARNYLSSQGKDFDKEFNAFKQQFGL